MNKEFVFRVFAHGTAVTVQLIDLFCQPTRKEAALCIILRAYGFTACFIHFQPRRAF